MQCRADGSPGDEMGYAMGDVLANMSHDGVVEDATGSALPPFGRIGQRDTPGCPGTPAVVQGAGVTHLRYPVEKASR